jgi:hypothetical protein
LHSSYEIVHPIHKPDFLHKFWEQDRFSKWQRLQFIYEVIRDDNSLRALHAACVIMNLEAKISKNILGDKQYLEWWERNKEHYKGMAQ